MLLQRRLTMRSRYFAGTGVAAAFALALAASPVQAHHGWSGQGTEGFELAGTVQTAVSLAGQWAFSRRDLQ